MRRTLRLILATGRIAALSLAVYALAFCPAYKLCFDHPAIASRLGTPFQIMYSPLIEYICQHPYGRVDNFYYWYATRICHIPLVRN